MERTGAKETSTSHIIPSLLSVDRTFLSTVDEGASRQKKKARIERQLMARTKSISG